MSYIAAYSITYSYILCILLAFIRGPIKKYVGVLLVFLLWVVTTLELYVIIFVQTRFTPFILQVVSETNPRETTEFISNYITKVPVIVFFTVTIFAFVFFFLILIKSNHATKTNNKLFKTLINVVVIYSFSVAIFCSLQKMKELQGLTALDTLIYSIKQKADTNKDIERLNLAASSIKAIQSNQTGGI
jgi:glucan phosphoethanolaminetransferase (alkaline phosphatase superfamily)